MAQYETEFRQEERRKRKEYGCMDVDEKEPTRRNQALQKLLLTLSRISGFADSLKRKLKIACFLPRIALWIAVNPSCKKE